MKLMMNRVFRFNYKNNFHKNNCNYIVILNIEDFGTTIKNLNEIAQF